ncbi:MAG: HyaD/HybD family hydrogenase maturation endopeptidase [gamma proteobacterium symbiont of Bathyaustriella thionipta]|nr:HyaD/HybD family hydrogenase maturation endopeptidase [gamma proteobacterium symbiont of Bathyaustriella thionipta]MCU7951119.1 HyaD/HybD family hydrogenase maturation endopeptidase [gamma proteobacterium symbiont of Bathyaustriella thionipta]MCU7953328.1 HyaD/HybD family hydrogenase maturation endopeptidase [gamma proteobacterium symbiont of Bathyaustriella thionipta]MCU7957634.1 HyaD/HybD family hydrogenase maturation endopeptidase [gamma proteobacterium symbiont of Bathyaustriella thionipt
MAVILGIGNTLLKDEGIGIHLLNYIRMQNPQWESEFNIEMIDGGTLSFELLAEIQADQELLVLDAVNLKQAPGSVYCLQAQEMDQFLTQPGKSVHEVSLQDLFDMSRLLDQLPQKRALIGIQPETIDWGSHLSQSVQQSLAYAAIQANLVLEQWGESSARR